MKQGSMDNRLLCVQDNKTGLWYRPHYNEMVIIKEQSLYNHLDMNGRVCMDIGAHIGAFAVKAIKAGAAMVHCYEPDPYSFAVLERNEIPGMILHQKAVAVTKGSADLYLGRSYPYMNTTVRTKGRQTIKVDTVGFYDELRRVRPSLLKVDCEGAELDFITKPVPSFVTEIGMEIHFKGKQGLQKGIDLLQLFTNWHLHRNFSLSWNLMMLVASRNRVSPNGSVGNRLQLLSTRNKKPKSP